MNLDINGKLDSSWEAITIPWKELDHKMESLQKYYKYQYNTHAKKNTKTAEFKEIICNQQTEDRITEQRLKREDKEDILLSKQSLRKSLFTKQSNREKEIERDRQRIERYAEQRDMQSREKWRLKQ